MSEWATESRSVKARKAHRCSWCGEDIVRGEMYQTWTYGDPTPTTVRMHPECDRACSSRSDHYEPFDLYSRARGCGWCEYGCCDDPDYCPAQPAREREESTP